MFLTLQVTDVLEKVLTQGRQDSRKCRNEFRALLRNLRETFRSANIRVAKHPCHPCAIRHPSDNVTGTRFNFSISSISLP